MATIYHQVWINATASSVYQAIATAEGLGDGWTPHTTTSTDAGVVLAHDPGAEHGEMQMLMVDNVPNQRVEWEIISTHPSTSPASGWMGTRIVFEITERENPGARLGVSSGSPKLAVLDFRHSGWDENSEYFGFCNFAWGATLLMLQQWCEPK